MLGADIQERKIRMVFLPASSAPNLSSAAIGGSTDKNTEDLPEVL